ncbi:MAG: ATPase, T2SS/T4P/T4SS family, partial [Limnobacter sp.]|nr:ATPase, T2SS/T4P/T4SS family [Limnobacter sp.]
MASTTVDTIKSSGLFRALAAQNKLSEEDLEEHAEQPLEGRAIAAWLIGCGLISSADLASCVAHHFGFPLLDLSQVNFDQTSIDIGLSSATKGLDVIALGTRQGVLYVGVTDPTDLFTLQQLKFRTQLQVEPIVVEHHKLTRLQENSLSEQSGTELLIDVLDETDLLEDLDTEDTSVEDAPIVKFVQRVLLDAIRLGASDIHMEPYEKQYRIRYRIDGVLQETSQPPLAAKNKIAARIKIMSKLNTTETRIPQDGRLRVRANSNKNQKIDFRVSTLPTLFGEKIVMRLLNSNQSVLKLDMLGMNDQQMGDIRKALEMPHGMILVTGPTGSGKTVSLYTFLSMLNEPSVNISTVEDPCEINLPGVNQVSVNDKVGLTFAKTLKALLRQDPDVIMVGEIRDLETADISIKASQTGHLVLSTLHTNDAVSTIVRLKNMGVELFNIASSVNLVIAQRLVRKLCSCKMPHSRGPRALQTAGLISAEEATQS